MEYIWNYLVCRKLDGIIILIDLSQRQKELHVYMSQFTLVKLPNYRKMCVCVCGGCFLGSRRVSRETGRMREDYEEWKQQKIFCITPLKLIFPFDRYGNRGLVVMKTDLRFQPRFTYFKDSLLLPSWNSKILYYRRHQFPSGIESYHSSPNPFLFL